MSRNDQRSMHPNKFLYLKAPTYEQIDEAFKKSGAKSFNQYERVYGMTTKVVTKCKCNRRPLPPQFWHIIYNTLGIPPDNPNYKKPITPIAKNPIAQKSPENKRAKKDPALAAFL